MVQPEWETSTMFWFFIGLGGFICLLSIADWFEAKTENEKAQAEYWEAKTERLERSKVDADPEEFA